IAQVLTKTEKGMAHLGDWYVPEEVGKVFNNYLHPGLGQNPLASISALGNRIRVEFSAFHFLLTSMSHAAQQVGDHFVDGLGDIAHGNVVRGAGKLALTPAKMALTPAGIYRDWRAGRDTISKALGGHFDDPAVSDAILGGEGFNQAFDSASDAIA